jgi:hypothetical protein
MSEVWRVKVGGEARQDFATAWEADEFAAYLRDEEKLPARVVQAHRMVAEFDLEVEPGRYDDPGELAGEVATMLEILFGDLERDEPGGPYTIPDRGDVTVWLSLDDAVAEEIAR